MTVVDRYAPDGAGHEVQVITQDLDDPPTFDAREYEYILLLDVIEHLRDPERFLEQLRRQFDHEPKKLVLTTPNIAFVVQRLMLARRAVQLRQGRHPRPHAHAAVHVPVASGTCCATRASASRP